MGNPPFWSMNHEIGAVYPLMSISYKVLNRSVNGFGFYCVDAEGDGDGMTSDVWSNTSIGFVKSSPAVADNKVYINDIPQKTDRSCASP